MKCLAMLLPISLLCFSSSFAAQDGPLDQAAYTRMARHIVRALKPQSGERVILRYDAETLPALEPVLRKALEEAGAVVETMSYGQAQNFAERLSRADIYIWLPAGPNAPTPPDQAGALVRWLDAGKGRQIHFHWGDGTRATDGLNGDHSEAYDRVYMRALDIDYAALDKQMDRAITKLRSGEVRVTTPAGTDISFRIGDRPFCKQNGDASKARMTTAKVRIDREIELPAGALRVAPVESSVNGRMVIPWARIGNVEVEGIRLEISKGVVTSATSATHGEALQRYMDSGPGLKLFRELAIGFNPRLVTPKGERWVAYYGYGAGAVRLGLGDNEELGGEARGLPIRWLFFQDATVRVENDVIVDKGRLVEGKR
ncbi:MAG: aminopeptidase [Blastocatellia bacterium]|nr:aminopeptidase [Blastocatellia bacterium]